MTESAYGTPPRYSAEAMLAELVAFDTTSRNSNLALVDFVTAYLDAHGVAHERVMNEDGTKANLYATIGPDVAGGIILSGHTDVVPVDGQDWSSDPFRLTERQGLLYGRGATDMKGFLAAVLALVPDFVAARAARPIHLAFSYDEEIGCVGVRPMLEHIAAHRPRPAIAIIGEPTSMTVVNAHKGIQTFQTRITGQEAHSSRTHEGVSAVTAAARLVLFLEELAQDMRERGDPSGRFDPPCTTLSVGRIDGGTAVNIIPGECQVIWECRPLPGTDEDEILTRVQTFTQNELVPAMRTRAPQATIETERQSLSPGLRAEDGSPAEALVLRLAQQNNVHAVAYGTEAGLFQAIDIPSVVCGPGDIAQAHKPDEFLARTQLDQCTQFLARLVEAIRD